MVTRKVANPAPAALVLVNPVTHICSVCGKSVGRKGYCAKHPNAQVDSVYHNGGKSMPARKRSTRRKTRRVHHRSNPVRRTRKATTRRHSRVHASHARRRNPLFAHKKRRSVRRHRNPVSGAIGEAIPLVGASFAISFAAPIVQGLVGRFLPLGSLTTPVVTAGTGYGLGWVAHKLGFGKYQKPLQVMGVTLGLTALVAPYLRGLFQPAQPAQQTGMNGRRGMNGIAAVAGVPPQLVAAPPKAAAAGGMRGIASYQVPGRFGR